MILLQNVKCEGDVSRYSILVSTSQYRETQKTCQNLIQALFVLRIGRWLTLELDCCSHDFQFEKFSNPWSPLRVLVDCEVY